ncbi:MAG TPA: TonB-dependent receptor [Terriglobales bacterium]|nr:TonB-dependent receptor [Terriglobales bacterium]
MKRIMKAACWMSLIMLMATVAAAQNAATADLRGTVKDPNGAVVSNATVTIRDESRNFERSVKSDAEGNYLIPLLPPGNYTMQVDAAGFAKVKTTNVRLNVGQTAELPIALKVAGSETEVTVNADSQMVETNRSSVATTVDQQRIENLPINERSYLSFALTTSTVGRDNGRAIGPAPTSGLNIGGQRGRSTLVQVDGADNTDTSVNAARSTLSQEAVQEFQVVTNSYAAEFGRASGGVVNVVSKSGNNDLHGNLFGFLRHRSFQAKNAFSPIDNPPYTRTQYGATIGGPIVKDKTFYFGAVEQRRRQESGFFTSDVVGPLTASTTIPVIAGLNPIARTFTNLTSAQATFINTLIGSGVAANICAARTYAFMASTGGNLGLTGTTGQISPNDGSLCPAFSPIAPGVIGPRFLLSGAPIPSGTVNAAGLPIAFRPLTQLQRIFPVSEGTTFTSLRLDHRFTPSHHLTMRAGFNPSKISGIQVESQNQALGQNDFSRTGLQQFRDWSALVGLNSSLTGHLVNEANFNYGRRSAQFRSQNGDAVAVNITGTAFFGRELFSPVRRVEERYQIRDNVSWLVGNHVIKFGGDVNFVDVSANFELNFSGLFNFGGLGAANLIPGLTAAPDFTPVQQYGLGFPANYIQGFGNPNSALSNKPIAFFVQDSWQITRNLTLNFGVRYDNELTAQIRPVGVTDPLSGIVLTDADMLAAQDAMNAQQGFPRDNNNIAPRFALAWDPYGDGKSVFRAAYGLFYDHPLAAIAFNSDIADAAQQQQLVSLPGSPAQTASLNATQIFMGTVCVPGHPVTPICPAGVNTPGVAPTAQYQFGRMRFNDQTFPGFGPVLPFTLHVAKDFEYAYAHQASASFEHSFTDDVSLSVGYLMVGTRHLPRPIDVNAPQMDLLVQNFQRFAGRAPTNTTEAQSITMPGAPGFVAPAGQTYTIVVPGFIAVNNNTGLRFVNPAAANFFRPNAPNYFLVRALTGLSKATFDSLLAGSLRTPGVLSPFGSINMQSSNGTSNYHAMNVDLKKRFNQNFQFLASYTWSHSIDDSSDLQTLLLPQDNRNLRAERSDSLFDQRHRFVFSGIVTSPTGWRGGGAMRSILADFTIAPVIELSSGRPFNILSGVDTNADQSNQTDRPNVSSAGVLSLPAPFTTGNLPRNAGISRGFAQVDLRISRALRITERLKLDVIAEGFNLLNRFNQAGSSPFLSDVAAFNKRDGANRFYSRPTAAFDPRQFQFGLKLGW